MGEIMAREKIFKCPICKRSFLSKQAVYTHMYKEHADEIPDGMSAAQYAFNLRNNKKYGLCVQCRTRKTKWNEEAERYDRFCSKECRDAYVAEAKRRMIKKYGKEHLLNDADHQQKMLNGRSISGHYTFDADKTAVPYTGQLEYAFLRHLNLSYGWNGKDIAQCPYVFEYVWDNKKRLYIPDYYLVQFNTIVECKSSVNNHPKYIAVDREMEKEKDKIMLEQNEYNFIKIYDEKYAQFSYLIKLLKDLYWDSDNPDLQPKVNGIKLFP
jgi:endogenous inhibitor of DNA gyrase (YacG/DUF329 family)